MLKYKINGILLLLVLLSFGQAQPESKTAVAAGASCGCDHTIPLSRWRTDAAVEGIGPGDVVCLAAGTRGGMRLQNFAGTAAEPIVVQNCGGKTEFVAPSSAGYGISIGQSQHLHLTGSGDANITYGIEVHGPNLGIAVGGLSSNIEVDHTEVHDIVFAGFMVKTDPSCDPATWRENFTMYDVSLHDNYIHYTHDGEGMYVGFTFYGGYDITCDGQPTTVYGHVIEGLQLYDNLIEDTGSEAIQVGSTPVGAEIYNNVVRLYGQRPFAAYQNNGIQIGSGTGGKVYNNWIQEGNGNALIILTGIADNQFYNNVIIDAGASAIFIDERDAVVGDGFQIVNNTIVNPMNEAIVLYSDQVDQNYVKNNIIVQPDGNYLKLLNGDVPVDSSNNLMVETVAEAGFINASQHQYRLQSTSAAIDMGMNAATFDVIDDFAGTARPLGNGYDAGSYEYILPTHDIYLAIIMNASYMNASYMNVPYMNAPYMNAP